MKCTFTLTTTLGWFEELKGEIKKEAMKAMREAVREGLDSLFLPPPYGIPSWTGTLRNAFRPVAGRFHLSSALAAGTSVNKEASGSSRRHAEVQFGGFEGLKMIEGLVQFELTVSAYHESDKGDFDYFSYNNYEGQPTSGDYRYRPWRLDEQFNDRVKERGRQYFTEIFGKARNSWLLKVKARRMDIS